MGSDQNFVLFPNMCSEILCLFLLESSEGILERSKKVGLDGEHQGLQTPITLFTKVLRIVRIGNFVKRTLLYKM